MMLSLDLELGLIKARLDAQKKPGKRCKNSFISADFSCSELPKVSGGDDMDIGIGDLDDLPVLSSPKRSKRKESLTRAKEQATKEYSLPQRAALKSLQPEHRKTVEDLYQTQGRKGDEWIKKYEKFKDDERIPFDVVERVSSAFGWA